MKIERISDNQIRCTLTSLDLSSRGINLAELAYGSEKARNLFREMIQQAAQEVGFEAEDIPLMVEAIPLSSESIMLIVTKVEDPEELDTRFSKFSPFAEAESENLLSQLADEFLEGAGDLAKLLGQNGTEELKANVNTAAENTGTEKLHRSNCALSVLTVWIRSVKLQKLPKTAVMTFTTHFIKNHPPVSIIWY